jgi:hypothetical protein
LVTYGFSRLIGLIGDWLLVGLGVRHASYSIHQQKIPQILIILSCYTVLGNAINSLTANSCYGGEKKSVLLAKHKDTNIPTMMEPFPSSAAWF